MTGRNRGFAVIAGGRLVPLVRCEDCGAVLTPKPGKPLGDVIEQHARWHHAMEAAAEEIKAELREQGWDL